MCAFGADCLDLSIASVEKQDLTVLNALDLDLLLDAGAKMEGADVFEFVFFRHGYRRCDRKCTCLARESNEPRLSGYVIEQDPGLVHRAVGGERLD